MPKSCTRYPCPCCDAPEKAKLGWMGQAPTPDGGDVGPSCVCEEKGERVGSCEAHEENLPVEYLGNCVCCDKPRCDRQGAIKRETEADYHHLETFCHAPEQEYSFGFDPSLGEDAATLSILHGANILAVLRGKEAEFVHDLLQTAYGRGYRDGTKRPLTQRKCSNRCCSDDVNV